MELLQANKLIQKKNAELESYKDELLLIYNILSHDIASDLAVIESALALYREIPEDAMLNEIEKRTTQCIRTIRNQRSMVSSLHTVHQLKTYSFDEILGGLASKHQKVLIKINGNGNVLADEAIYSVFENLANNSLIHGKASEITIDILPKKNYFEIHFADNGTGIPKKVIPNIFQEGYSYGKSANTGIGLHIVKSTIERYGGTISVNENNSSGTAFIITLRKAD